MEYQKGKRQSNFFLALVLFSYSKYIIPMPSIVQFTSCEGKMTHISQGQSLVLSLWHYPARIIVKWLLYFFIKWKNSMKWRLFYFLSSWAAWSFLPFLPSWHKQGWMNAQTIKTKGREEECRKNLVKEKKIKRISCRDAVKNLAWGLWLLKLSMFLCPKWFLLSFLPFITILPH